MKRCKKGIWDNSIPGINFNENDVSNYATIQENLMRDFPKGESGEAQWEKIVSKIKSKNGRYDCLIGVSGGTDSSYLLHLAKKYNLNPLAVNLDNGWSSNIAVENIKRVTSQLNIDLETYVIDYEEIKDILRSYLRAGLPWIDNPTDQAIHSVLYKTARREKIKYILMGTDFRSEGKQPTEWTYSDSKQLKHIHNKFGEKPRKTFPLVSFPKYMYYGYLKNIKVIQPFNYIEYNKQEAQDMLIQLYNWEYYGEHHHENLFTKWVISYWMYEKFKIDKRIITYSAQVLSGKISRDRAIAIISKKPYNEETIESETEFVLKKLSISKDEFNDIWKSDNKSFLDYPSYYSFIKKAKRILLPIIKYALPTKPKIFYEMEVRK
ncbi:MAG: hypothetical protein CL663_08295 [Bacteroidetes bacterium]|nr:hypothetical protein [Bacteroidota bacterium]